MAKYAIDDEPAWLKEAVERRLAEQGDTLLKAALDTDMTTVFTFLTDDPEGPFEVHIWERTCDKCGTYISEGPGFNTGMTHRKLSEEVTIYIAFGVCQKCLEEG